MQDDDGIITIQSTKVIQEHHNDEIKHCKCEIRIKQAALDESIRHNKAMESIQAASQEASLEERMELFDKYIVFKETHGKRYTTADQVLCVCPEFKALIQPGDFLPPNTAPPSDK
jgi:hypothetical protein